MSATLALQPAPDFAPRPAPHPTIVSAHALCRAVREARRDAACVDTGGLDRVLRKDVERGQIEVQRHARWEDVARALAAEVPALAACVAAGRLSGTVGAAVAENAPGPDGTPLVALLESLTLVTADGELRRASRNANAELFALAVGGFDLFGLTYSVTLSIAALARATQDPAAPVLLVLDDAAAARPLALMLPPESLEAFLAEARREAEAWRVPIARIEVSRSAAEAETVLRWARRDYACATLHLALPARLAASVRATQFCRLLIDAAMRHGGAYRIACTPEASREQASACYPGLKRMLAEKRRLDPAGKLQNAWFRHHCRLLRMERIESRWC